LVILFSLLKAIFFFPLAFLSLTRYSLSLLQEKKNFSLSPFAQTIVVYRATYHLEPLYALKTGQLTADVISPIFGSLIAFLGKLVQCVLQDLPWKGCALRFTIKVGRPLMFGCYLLCLFVLF
jgi:hypothetical protein